jgi:hypothetical protein
VRDAIGSGVKNPARVPEVLARFDPVGTAGAVGRGVQIVPGRPPGPATQELPRTQELPPMSIKANRDTGNYEVQVDGVYEHSLTHDRFQFRKGQIVPEGDAQFFSRTGPWPGETDEAALERETTGGSRKAAEPENKAAHPPENKSA